MAYFPNSADPPLQPGHPSFDGYLAASLLRQQAVSAPLLSLNTATLVKIPTGQGGGTVNNLDIYLVTGGTSLTANANYAGLFDKTGVALWRSAAGVCDTLFNQTGKQTVPVSGIVLPGDYVFAVLVVNGSGTPNIQGLNSLPAAFVNANLSAANYNVATVPAGVATYTVSAGGTTYSVGDLLTFPGGSGVGFEATVATLSGSAVATLTVTSIGSGYNPTNVLPAAGGHGTGCQVTVSTTGVPSLTRVFDPTTLVSVVRWNWVGLR